MGDNDNEARGPEARRAERHRVSLSVRYATARDYVIEYAENLSTGGLFVRGPHHLWRGQQVNVILDLPGFGEFECQAMVAHVLTPEQAEGSGRHPGAGFQLQKGPVGFTEALRDYLLRLGKRRDHVVFVENLGLRVALGEAGYQVRPLPDLDALLEEVARSDDLVIGVVVSADKQADYSDKAMAMGAPELVMLGDSEDELDKLLAALDEELSGA